MIMPQVIRLPLSLIQEHLESILENKIVEDLKKDDYLS